MKISCKIEELRNKAYDVLNQTKRKQLGQFYTPYTTSLFMASLFDDISGHVKLLDPGCGIGSLTGAFIEETFSRKQYKSLDCELIDIESEINSLVKEFTLSICNLDGVNAVYEQADFIQGQPSLFQEDSLFMNSSYTHCIMNPPYKKIPASGKHRKLLREQGIETGNLYSAFVSLALKRLTKGGELVAIIPRSFCNGPYFKPFREQILAESAIKHIHIFESRSKTFKEDSVLQENIIIHLIKGEEQGGVTLSSSISGDFQRIKGNLFNATGFKSRAVSFDSVVKPSDTDKFIYLPVDKSDELAIEQLTCFSSSLEEMNISVSTGPVVGFRSRDFLLDQCNESAVPLFYPAHFSNNKVIWPSKEKPNSLSKNYPKKNDFWLNKGAYLVVNRFSAKEEKRRISAHIFSEFTDSEYVAFENKLNVFHIGKKGFSLAVVKGLYIYLNSTLVDNFFRQFSGHTQVNATDLRNMHYPSLELLEKIGSSFNNVPQTQIEVDTILAAFIPNHYKKETA